MPLKLKKPLKSGKTMPAAQMQAFVAAIDRAELDDNPAVYLKAVCVTLLALGYDLEWINGILRPQLEKAYWREE